MNVSRETEAVPESVRQLFGNDKTISRYVDLLATVGVERGLIGPREAPRLWSRHVLNCAVVRELMPSGASVADVGSGAGLPGLVLAISRRDLAMTLIEPLLRRATFLTEAVDLLGLTNVTVVRSRAEDLNSGQSFDVVTSRAVAPLPKLLAWCLPLCKPGGEIVAIKGSSAADEVAAGTALLARHRVTAQVVEVGAGVVDPITTVIRIQSSGQLPRTSPTTDRKRRR